MSTLHETALGSITNDGLLNFVNGNTSTVSSNAAASPSTNYFIKDLGGENFVSAALPTAISIPTVVVTSATQAAASNTAYVMQCVTGISTITLPASPAIGDVVVIAGGGAATAPYNFVVALGTTQTYSGISGIPSAAGVTLTSTTPGASAQFRAASAGATANWQIITQGGSFLVS